jgi:hypothetical protein
MATDLEWQSVLRCGNDRCVVHPFDPFQITLSRLSIMQRLYKVPRPIFDTWIELLCHAA